MAALAAAAVVNCKQGDLALVIGPAGASCVGKVVTCLTFVPANTPACSADQSWTGVTSEDAWVTDTPLFPAPQFESWGAFNYAIGARYLLPLRPPADDETDTADQDLPAECGV